MSELKPTMGDDAAAAQVPFEAALETHAVHTAINAEEIDMLVHMMHLGMRNCDYRIKRYVFRQFVDGTAECSCSCSRPLPAQEHTIAGSAAERPGCEWFQLFSDDEPDAEEVVATYGMIPADLTPFASPSLRMVGLVSPIEHQYAAADIGGFLKLAQFASRVLLLAPPSGSHPLHLVVEQQGVCWRFNAPSPVCWDNKYVDGTGQTCLLGSSSLMGRQTT